MATVFYDQAAVRITTADGVQETVLATDCSVNFSSSQTPIYSIGKKGSLGQFPSAARAGDVSFSFLTTITGNGDGKSSVGGVAKAGNIINYMASGIKNSTNSLASGVIIQVAGLSGTGFLNSYSFNIGSNTVSTSSAAFTLFGSGSTETPVIGRLSGSLYSPDGNTGLLATGVGHGRFTTLGAPFQTTISAPTAGTENGTIFGADYSVSFNHNPVYKIGQEFPTTTFYTTAAESVNVTEDVFNSGLAFNETPTDATISVKGLNSSTPFGTMNVGLNGLKQVSTSMTAGLDDIVRTQKTLTTSY